MRESFTVKQMRDADRYTIETLGVPSLVLMERAGAAIAEQAFEAAERLKIDDVLVVCGGGNNGGDGFVAARVLQEKGLDVQVLCLAQKFSPDCAAMKEKFTGEILCRMPRRRYGLMIDCIFGTGLCRPVAGAEAALIDFINSNGAYVLSADIPSGLNGDNGLVMGVCVRADLTVTIGSYKNGLFLNDGVDYCGKIVRADIGIDTSACGKACRILGDKDIAAYFPRRRRNTHKGSYGKVTLIAGSKAYSGAALLSCGAALRGGAGYTQLCVPQGIFGICAGKLPEALITRFSGEEGFVYNESELEKITASDCVVLGMGCGISLELYKMTAWLLQNYTGNLVIDADGLNALSGYGVEILKNKKCRVLVTPHVKEFSRISGLPVSEIAEDGITRAKNFAREYGVTVLLKSAVSVLTDGEEVWLNLRGSAALAKGGSGDVLAGLIGSTCARGVSLTQSALVGSYLMGVAAEICEEEQGEYSVVATDVIQNIPSAVLRVTENADKKGGE